MKHTQKLKRSGSCDGGIITSTLRSFSSLRRSVYKIHRLSWECKMNIHETRGGGELFVSVYRQFKRRDMCVCILPKTKKKNSLEEWANRPWIPTKKWKAKQNVNGSSSWDAHLKFYLVGLILSLSLTITEHILLHYWSNPVTVSIQINNGVNKVRIRDSTYAYA